MIKNIRLALQGKKTYLVGISAILAAIIAFAGGEMDIIQTGQSIVAAIMGMTIKASTVANK